jgi:hypothetical protein
MSGPRQRVEPGIEHFRKSDVAPIRQFGLWSPLAAPFASNIDGLVEG